MAQFADARARGIAVGLLLAGLALAVLSSRLVGVLDHDTALGWSSQPPTTADSVAGLTALGLRDYEAGDFASADRDFRAARDLDPGSARTLFNLGTARLGLGDPASARDLFRQAVAIDPMFSEAQYNLGVASWALGDEVSAERAYRAAMATDPESPDIAWNLGLLLSHRGPRAEAQALLHRAIAAKPVLLSRLPADVVLDEVPTSESPSTAQR